MRAVRFLAVVCVLFAATSRGFAQPAPPDAGVAEPDAAAAPPAPAPPPPPAPAPASPPALKQGDKDAVRAAAEQRCSDRAPDCDWIAALSSLERKSVERAVRERGYEIDPAPWGKVIAHIYVFNDEVFAEGAAYLRFFNNFHVTTTEHTIHAEAVISEGEIWDQDRIEETARRLRDPLWTSVVAVIPVRSKDPNQVDALIVTRDIWSLRLNTTYAFQEGTLTNLAISLSENNFLGHRDVLSLAMAMDQGAIAVGPIFVDKNLLGEHLDFRVSASEIFTRDALQNHSTLHSEGSQSTITIARPLWSLASEWGAGASFSHRYAVDRVFQGLALRQFTFTDPVTNMPEMFDQIWSAKSWGINTYAIRQWGTFLKQQLTLGYSVNNQTERPLKTFPGDDGAREAFIENVLPPSETTSTPYVEYAFFQPRYRTLRNITTFDLAEDTRIGPDFDVTIGMGVRALGSDYHYEDGNGSIGWTFAWARDGFIRPFAGLATRHQGGRFIDDYANVGFRAATPVVQELRLVVSSQLFTRWREERNRSFAIGGADSGLRGFAINQFFIRNPSERLMSTQVELRTQPWVLWVLRLGGVAFYEVGGVGPSVNELVLHHDVGLGFRMLIPQTSANLLRFDLAMPLDGPNGGRTVKFSAGFGSSF